MASKVTYWVTLLGRGGKVVGRGEATEFVKGCLARACAPREAQRTPAYLL